MKTIEAVGFILTSLSLHIRLYEFQLHTCGNLYSPLARPCCKENDLVAFELQQRGTWLYLNEFHCRCLKPAEIREITYARPIPPANRAIQPLFISMTCQIPVYRGHIDRIDGISQVTHVARSVRWWQTGHPNLLIVMSHRRSLGMMTDTYLGICVQTSKHTAGPLVDAVVKILSPPVCASLATPCFYEVPNAEGLLVSGIYVCQCPRRYFCDAYHMRRPRVHAITNTGQSIYFTFCAEYRRQAFSAIRGTNEVRLFDILTLPSVFLLPSPLPLVELSKYLFNAQLGQRAASCSLPEEKATKYS
ncbi:hypothetical protein ACTXT7_007054 [Hymenolepis weldensis]